MEGSEDLFTSAMQMQTQTQTQMEIEASSHVQGKCKEREIRKRSKSIFPRWPTSLGLNLAFAFTFALGSSHEQFLVFAFSFAEIILMRLIDRGRCGYSSYYSLRDDVLIRDG